MAQVQVFVHGPARPDLDLTWDKGPGPKLDKREKPVRATYEGDTSLD